MNKSDIRELSENIRQVDGTRFVSCVDHYLKNSAATDETLKRRNPWKDTLRSLAKHYLFGKKQHEAAYTDIEQESSAVLAQISRVLNQIADFRFSVNGYKGASQTEDQSRLYFGKLRQQQTALLMGLSDEIEIIRNIIQQSGKLLDIIREERQTMQHSAWLMDVIGERFSQKSAVPRQSEDNGVSKVGFEKSRFMPVPDPGADQKQLRQITGTFRRIRDYEESFGSNLTWVSEDHPLKQVIAAYCELTQGTREDIEQRKQKIIGELKELRMGWSCLEELAINGYSPRMQGKIDILLCQHDARIYEFQKYIREARLEHRHHH
jgi:hypothetical protein